MYDKLDTLSPNSIQDWIVIWCDLLEKWFKSPYTWTRRLKPLILQLSMKVFESLAKVFPNPD